jgi:alpha-galactosidase
VNNWEATYFDFTGEKLIEIAKQAKELGIEMLVMDDGWFGKRDDDNSGLGDWFVNEEKLGCSLSEFVNQINKIGLKFGLWFELEMVSEDSCLYREHPEWCLTVPGRKPFRGRNQLVLDMGRKDVQEYIKKCFFDIMDQANIEYVKLDMNRSIGNVYANDLPAQRQGEVLHRYVLGLYNVLNAIVERYPDLLIESCSGGGGRFDAGMLYYAPQAWCSDNTDAIDRIKIQYGSSFGYPISSVGSHVSVCPNEQTGRTVPIETRGAVAMAGTFGYELDLTQMNDEDKEAVKIQIEQYKKYADIIRQGQYYRITNPMENTEFAAWEFVSEEKDQALMFYTALNSNSNGRVHLLKFKGLDPEKIYVIEGNTRKYYGKTLMYAGIPVPMRVKEYETMTFYVKEALL